MWIGVLSLGAQEAWTGPERQLYLDSFDQVWTRIRDQYWDPAYLEDAKRGFSWTALKAELRPKVAAAKSPGEARGYLQELLKRLNLSHFGIIGAEAYRDLEVNERAAPGDGQTGLEIAVIDGRAYVQAVESGSPASTAQIRTGWRITKIGSQDVDPLLARIAKNAKPGQVQHVQQAVMLARLAGPPGTLVTVVFEDANGVTVTRSIDHAEPKGRLAKFGFLPPIPMWVDTKQIEGSTGTVGYVRFNLFLDPMRLMPAIEKAVDQCAGKCRGFVIDLRGNPGGIGILSTGLAGYFIEQPDLKLGSMIRRDTTLNFVVNPRAVQFTGPLAVLIDSGTGSTSEIFAGGVKDLGRARIFGTRSMGAALPSVIEKLPSGDGFQYAVANYISQNGKPLEGEGVVPDTVVAHTRASLLAGKDAPLDAALEWIYAQKNIPESGRVRVAPSPGAAGGKAPQR